MLKGGLFARPARLLTSGGPARPRLAALLSDQSQSSKGPSIVISVFFT